jgi:regulator of nonsense transcripts 2
MLFRVKEDPIEEEDDEETGTDEPAEGAEEEGKADEEPAEADAEEETEDWEEEEDEAEEMPAADGTWEDGLAPTDPLMVLLEALPNCVNRADIDKAAIDFCHLNNKGNRKRLALSLFSVRKARTDLLPFYARLVAILDPGMADVAEDLVGHLLGEFRFHMRKKIQVCFVSNSCLPVPACVCVCMCVCVHVCVCVCVCLCTHGCPSWTCSRLRCISHMRAAR